MPKLLMLFLMALPVLGIALFFVLPLGLALPLYLVALVVGFFGYRLMMRAIHLPVITGVEGLVGAEATVISWQGGRGEVRCHGEVWSAVGNGVDPAPGADVTVRAVKGLVLVVGAPASGVGNGAR